MRDFKALVEHAVSFVRAFQEFQCSRTEAMARILATPAACFGLGDVTILQSLTEWAAIGCPRVETTHKHAAYLMCTGITQDSADDVQLPWPIFSVLVPDGLLQMQFRRRPPVIPSDPHHPSWNEQPYREADVLCAVFAKARYVSMTEPVDGGPGMTEGATFLGVSVVVFPRGEELCPIVQVLRGELGMLVARGLRAPTTTPEANIPALELLARYALGAAVEMDTYRPKGTPAAGVPPTPHVWPSTGKLQPLIVRLQPRCGTLDLRSEVPAAIKHALGASHRGGGPVTVRTRVRAHWKRQRCGLRGEDRKWIRVESFWRGNPDAPVSAHGVRLGD